jgi:hypothetical protein
VRKRRAYIQEIAVQLCYGKPTSSAHRCGRGETINALGCGPSHYGFESHRSPLWVLETGSVAQLVEQLVEAQSAQGRNLPDPPRLRSSIGRALIAHGCAGAAKHMDVRERPVATRDFWEFDSPHPLQRFVAGAARRRPRASGDLVTVALWISKLLHQIPACAGMTKICIVRPFGRPDASGSCNESSL